VVIKETTRGTWGRSVGQANSGESRKRAAHRDSEREKEGLYGRTLKGSEQLIWVGGNPG